MERKNNWFARTALIMVALLLAAMIIYKFFYNKPIAEISSGIIILLCLLIVLALSEVFDNFSVGEI